MQMVIEIHNKVIYLTGENKYIVLVSMLGSSHTG